MIDHVELNEVFTSIQGESPFTGWPAFFIRFSGCIAPFCSYCDTKHSWESGVRTPIDSLVTAAKAATENWPRKLVVVSGGEPVRQADALALLCSKLNAHGMQVQIETSGKLPFPQYLLHSVTIVCSPKYYEDKFVIHPDALSSHYFKFVVGDDVDLDRIVQFINEKGLDKENCYLMPKGATREEQQALMPKVVEYCKKTGLLFSSRLHILIWDKKRGV